MAPSPVTGWRAVGPPLAVPAALAFSLSLALEVLASARCGLLLGALFGLLGCPLHHQRSAGIVAPKISMNCCFPVAELAMFIERRMCVQRMLQGSVKENIAKMCSSVVTSPTKLTWSFETGGPLRAQLGHPSLSTTTRH